MHKTRASNRFFQIESPILTVRISDRFVGQFRPGKIDCTRLRTNEISFNLNRMIWWKNNSKQRTRE